MNSLIREKRKLVFEGKRFTPEIVRQFAAVIDEEGHKESSAVLLYSVDTTDESSFESSSSIIFHRGNFLILGRSKKFK